MVHPPKMGIKNARHLRFCRENDIIHLLREDYIGTPGIVPIRSGVTSTGADFLLSVNIGKVDIQVIININLNPIFKSIRGSPEFVPFQVVYIY